jgi:hypothetical protein
MEINLTKEQFRTLIKLLYLGEWAANGHRLRDEYLKEYEDVEQHILKIAEKEGFSELAEFIEDLDGVFPTSDLEEEMQALIEEHEVAVLWETLPLWLAKRDLSREFGLKALKTMDEEKYAIRMFRLAETYEREFEVHGLERLEIGKK